MKNSFIVLFFALSSILAPNASAGPFWFPLDGHYPYSNYNNIQAVPDLDQRKLHIRSRMNETGKYSNGCLNGLTGGSCGSSSTFSNSSVWGYKKDGGGNWQLDGVPYVGSVAYLYYDNHRGYDFAVPSGTGVHAVEDGTFCGYDSTLGQICIQHSIESNTYRTYYSHMKNIPTWLKNASIGTFISQWTKIGTVSNVGTGGVHLHFVTYKYDPYHPNYSIRKTPIGSGWIVVDPLWFKKWSRRNRFRAISLELVLKFFNHHMFIYMW